MTGFRIGFLEGKVNGKEKQPNEIIADGVLFRPEFLEQYIDQVSLPLIRKQKMINNRSKDSLFKS